MSYLKYSFKDALLESAVREFGATETDASWSPSEKLISRINALSRKRKKRAVSPLVKWVAIAASAAVLFGVLASVRPVREGISALFGKTDETEPPSFTGSQTYLTEEETDRMTEKTGNAYPSTEPETEVIPKETTAPETEREPETPEEYVDALIDRLANKGYTAADWDSLRLMGETAFDRCVTRFMKTGKSRNQMCVMCIFAAEYIKDELEQKAPSLLSDCPLPETSGIAEPGFFGKSLGYKWISALKSSALTYAKRKTEEQIEKDTPILHRFLELIGFDDYRIDYDKLTVSECIDLIIEAKKFDGAYSNLVYDRKTETVEYCVKNYFSETDGDRRTVMSWLFYSAAQNSGAGMSALVGRDTVLSLVSAGGSVSVTDRTVFANVQTIEPLIARYADIARKEAKNHYEDVMKYDFPCTYLLLNAMGFNDYKPGKPDISFYARGAIRAAEELYLAVTDGFVPEALNDKTHPIESDAEREGLPERTRSEYYGYVPLSDFYAYFDKYIDRRITEGSLCNNDWFNVIGDRVYMFCGGPQSILGVDYYTTKLVERNGNKATLTADVSLPDGMFSYKKELTFEVKEYEDGIRLSGGVFAEKFLSPCRISVSAVSAVVSSYCVLREGQAEYNRTAGYLLSFDGQYNSLDEVPKKYRDIVRYGAEFPVWLTLDTAGDRIDRFTTDEVYAALTKKTDVFDRGIVYPAYAKTRTLPAFEHGYSYAIDNAGNVADTFITSYDFLLAMKDIDISDDTLICALDFTREENGVKKDVTYTFEIRRNVPYETQYGEVLTDVLVGGTFVTDVIMK